MIAYGMISVLDLVQYEGADHRFCGVVRSIFEKESGAVRCVVENPDGLLHILNPDKLTHISEEMLHDSTRN